MGGSLLSQPSTFRYRSTAKITPGSAPFWPILVPICGMAAYHGSKSKSGSGLSQDMPHASYQNARTDHIKHTSHFYCLFDLRFLPSQDQSAIDFQDRLITIAGEKEQHACRHSQGEYGWNNKPISQSVPCARLIMRIWETFPMLSRRDPLIARQGRLCLYLFYDAFAFSITLRHRRRVSHRTIP